jgi:hypothetical protein
MSFNTGSLALIARPNNKYYGRIAEVTGFYSTSRNLTIQGIGDNLWYSIASLQEVTLQEIKDKEDVKIGDTILIRKPSSFKNNHASIPEELWEKVEGKTFKVTDHYCSSGVFIEDSGFLGKDKGYYWPFNSMMLVKFKTEKKEEMKKEETLDKISKDNDREHDNTRTLILNCQKMSATSFNKLIDLMDKNRLKTSREIAALYSHATAVATEKDKDVKKDTNVKHELDNSMVMDIPEALRERAKAAGLGIEDLAEFILTLRNDSSKNEIERIKAMNGHVKDMRKLEIANHGNVMAELKARNDFSLKQTKANQEQSLALAKIQLEKDLSLRKLVIEEAKIKAETDFAKIKGDKEIKKTQAVSDSKKDIKNVHGVVAAEQRWTAAGLISESVCAFTKWAIGTAGVSYACYLAADTIIKVFAN